MLLPHSRNKSTICRFAPDSAPAKNPGYAFVECSGILKNIYTLLGKIMACFIMTGEIMGGEKYGGISPKPPIFRNHNFTCDFCFVKIFLNFKRIYLFLSVPDALIEVHATKSKK